ncbi:MAG TPA: right-handed parallel beta-helix repeat-containing protein, partial [Armatimonadota bacterium]|nr:right-handed parallel beta-helix repeat-containing protein [Armatimonadota bacterium]
MNCLQEIVHFPEGAIRNWSGLRDAELVIIPSHFWVSNILPIASVDEEAKTAALAAPGTYSLGRNGMRDRDTAWVENVLEVLDEPGEWVLDSEAARLTLWPKGDRPSDNIVAPLLTEFIRVEGETDNEGAEDVPARGLTFRGLTFTQGDRMPWHGNTGRGLQHDWEMFDQPTALVRLRGAEDCAVEDCHFVNSGHAAIRLDLHCQGNRIVGNHIERIGGVGVLLAGYGPGTKDVNRGNEVSNNYIHHIGRHYWGSVGIFAWQSGENRIAHNHIHHCPYTGIVVSGRISWDRNGVGECSRTVRWAELEAVLGEGFERPDWAGRERFLHGRGNVVERNDIHNVMRILGDGNCVYISGTGAGNVVRENYCHDCVGRYMNAVIRCDDDQHGTLIEGNIIHRTRGYAEGIISKGDNDIINNVIADLRDDQAHRGYVVFPYGSPKGSMITQNIICARQAGQIVLHEGKGRNGGPPALLRDTKADGNLYWCAEDPAWGEAHLTREREHGIEANSQNADPLFVDIDRGEFRFAEGSPAPEMGIGPFVSLDEVGLEQPYRDRLVGDTLMTLVSPPGGKLREPVEVTIESDAANAEIRYTLGGTEPTAGSALYGGPLAISETTTLRAKSFAPDAVDLVGAFAKFVGPPGPIVQDFEGLEVGARTPGAETSEENDTMTARVTDEQAAGGSRSLKFVDGPGQEHPFNPHVFYRTGHEFGRLVGRLDLRVDAATSFYYQWRDYTGAFVRGPTVQIMPGGQLVHDGGELMMVPLDEWVSYAVECGLGDDGDGTFELRVSLPGEEEPRVFPGLACEDGFHRLDWVGFVSPGQDDTTFYVDNVEVRRVVGE